MLFEEFVKQHRVHLIVAHGIRFSFLVAHDQIGIYVFHIFGHKTKLRFAIAFRINPPLITKANWLERKERLAGFVDWLDFIFEPAGRGTGAEPAVRIHEHSDASGRCRAKYVPDIATIGDVVTSGSDANNVAGAGDIIAGLKAQGRVVVAERAVLKCLLANSGGEATIESAVSRTVLQERLKAKRRVAATSRISKKCKCATGRVAAAGATAQKRPSASGGVVTSTTQ